MSAALQYCTTERRNVVHSGATESFDKEKIVQSLQVAKVNCLDDRDFPKAHISKVVHVTKPSEGRGVRNQGFLTRGMNCKVQIL